VVESALSITPQLDADDGLDQCFHEVSSLMGRISGVRLSENKIGLVRSRLRKRLRALDHKDFPEYLKFVQSTSGKEELSTMVGLLTTNKTSFFRESSHFDFLVKRVLPGTTQGLKIWCAGCSTGEEPYTTAMVLREKLPRQLADHSRILATDLSSEVLARAQEGTYPQKAVQSIPAKLGARYFSAASPATGEPQQRVNDELKDMIRFARLNLMRPWPMKGPFDMIWCRNVMIYFDTPTRERLVQRFSELLAPGGHLFVGHSEGLNSLRHDLKYIQPAVYRK
jgi:chemotaxis protein methyltransferase CheR